MNNYVTDATLVGEIVESYPEAIDVLLSSGMHCLGCPASQAKSLADACAVHGLDPSTLVDSVNTKIAEIRG